MEPPRRNTTQYLIFLTCALLLIGSIGNLSCYVFNIKSSSPELKRFDKCFKQFKKNTSYESLYSLIATSVKSQDLLSGIRDSKLDNETKFYVISLVTKLEKQQFSKDKLSNNSIEKKEKINYKLLKNLRKLIG